MKKILILSIALVSILSCTKSSDDKPLNTSSIVGTWQFVSVNSAWGNNIVDSGYTYTFNEDSTFTSIRFIECQEGTYSMTEATLSLVFGCEGFTTQIESPAGTFVENYSFTNNRLHLIPTYLNCTEGCTYIFKKIDEPEGL